MFEFLFGWIAALSFPWVLGLMLLGVVGFYSAVAARTGWTAFLIFAVMAGFISLSSFDLWGWMVTNWTTVGFYTIIYVLIGIAWTFAKWTLNLLKARKAYAALRAEFLPSFLDSKGVTELTPNLYEDFNKYLSQRDSAVVKAAAYANINSTFVADQTFLWPAYMFGFIIADALQAFADLLYRVFANSFKSIRNHVFRNMPELGSQ